MEYELSGTLALAYSLGFLADMGIVAFFTELAIVLGIVTFGEVDPDRKELIIGLGL
jgi:hypothetical protein